MMVQILNDDCWKNQNLNSTNKPVYIISQTIADDNINYFRNVEERINLREFNWLIYVNNKSLSKNTTFEKYYFQLSSKMFERFGSKIHYVHFQDSLSS